MRLLGRSLIFDLGAGFYTWVSSNDLWRESCASLAAFFPELNGHRLLRVLDLGCGPGVTAIALARARSDAHIIGVDLSRRMIDHARAQTARANLTRHISYVIADAAALPFPNDAVDLTTGHSFLYLVSDRAAVLKEACRVLRPGGRYASMEPRFARTRGSVVCRHWRNLRFLIAMAFLRPYSKYHGRLDEISFPVALSRIGFGNTGTEPALEGLGIIGHGEK